jgi:DNA mismatch repair protein MutS
VAQLAGVPNSVVRRARSLLNQLEERALGKRPQLDLFASTGAPASQVPDPDAELRKQLQGLDLDGVSPREAHALLEKLKREAEAD